MCEESTTPQPTPTARTKGSQLPTRTTSTSPSTAPDSVRSVRAGSPRARAWLHEVERTLVLPSEPQHAPACTAVTAATTATGLAAQAAAARGVGPAARRLLQPHAHPTQRGSAGLRSATPPHGRGLPPQPRRQQARPLGRRRPAAAGPSGCRRSATWCLPRRTREGAAGERRYTAGK